MVGGGFGALTGISSIERLVKSSSPSFCLLKTAQQLPDPTRLGRESGQFIRAPALAMSVGAAHVRQQDAWRIAWRMAARLRNFTG